MGVGAPQYQNTMAPGDQSRYRIAALGVRAPQYQNTMAPGDQNRHRVSSIPSSCHTQTPGIMTHGAKKSKITFAREAKGSYPRFSLLAPVSQNHRFYDPHRGMHNVRKTYYLLYFSYILSVPQPPKYRYFGYPKSTIGAPWHQVTETPSNRATRPPRIVTHGAES